MKRLFILLSISVMLMISCNTQKNINQVVYNEKVSQKILLGKIDREGLTKKPFKEWFTKEYDNYTPEAKTIEYLKTRVAENAEIIVVLATWCPDSRREVPRLYKILDEIEFDESKLTVIAVDRDFRANDEDVAQYKIERVPTIMYKHYGYEAGRITETPKISIESDLAGFTKAKGK